MKKLFIAVLTSSCLLAACDKVERPIETPIVIESKRKVLLEDYTGQQCGNCPAAAEVAETLKEQYGDKLVVLSVHAGFFARTSGTKFPTSYTTAASVEWDKTFIGTSGNPNGMVNRKNYKENGLVTTQSKWPTTVSLALQDIYFLDLYITPKYNTTSRALNTSVKAKFARKYSNNTKLSVILAEDSIIGPQTDYREKPDDYVPKYLFRYMLRGEINGTWGTALKSAPILYNDSVTVNFNNYTIDPKINIKNAYIIAFAFDETSKEVLQVEKVKIVP